MDVSGGDGRVLGVNITTIVVQLREEDSNDDMVFSG